MIGLAHRIRSVIRTLATIRITPAPHGVWVWFTNEEQR